MEGRSITRTDLVSPDPEPNKNPDPILESYCRQRLEELYADSSSSDEALNEEKDGNEVNPARRATPLEEAPGDRTNGEEYKFRLFARPPALSVDASSVHRRMITLRSLSPAVGGNGLGRSSSASRGRPDDYYFAGETSAELAAQYAHAATSGQEIIEGLKRRWKGMELPWRVTVTIKTTGGKDKESGLGVGVDYLHHQHHELQTQKSARKRSGKKRRVVMRRRAEKRAAEASAAKQEKVEKEIAEREKRTRRNREKKVKRRRKNALKKTVMDDGDDGEGVG